jgi:glucosyl-3-phosphoglycerate synthase
MSDLAQRGPITTLHDLHPSSSPSKLRGKLRELSREHKIGLVLPTTAADMRAKPFGDIVAALSSIDYIDTYVVTMGAAPSEDDFREAKDKLSPFGSKADVLWTDGPAFQRFYEHLSSQGFDVSVPGKGRSVWTAYGYLLADPTISTFVLHDCDIVNYDLSMLDRLCFPLVDPRLDFDFNKAYYARCTDRMYARVVRLLVYPLLQTLTRITDNDEYIEFLRCFRYPLAGEFAMTSDLARSNRIPSNWALEVGTLAEVFRNTSPKRVCQVDLGVYDHKHQDLSRDRPEGGLSKMASDIILDICANLRIRGFVFEKGHFATLRVAYLRNAQDAIRQYYADSLINELDFDRFSEEHVVDAFADQIIECGKKVTDMTRREGQSIPNWARIMAQLPQAPQMIRQAAAEG